MEYLTASYLTYGVYMYINVPDRNKYCIITLRFVLEKSLHTSINWKTNHTVNERMNSSANSCKQARFEIIALKWCCFCLHTTQQSVDKIRFKHERILNFRSLLITMFRFRNDFAFPRLINERFVRDVFDSYLHTKIAQINKWFFSRTLRDAQYVQTKKIDEELKYTPKPDGRKSFNMLWQNRIFW